MHPTPRGFKSGKNQADTLAIRQTYPGEQRIQHHFPKAGDAMPDGTQRCETDLAYLLSKRVRRGEDLVGVLIQQQMVIPEVGPDMGQ